MCEGIYRLHELLEIYFFFDQDCRRVFRVMFWYSKLIMMCALVGYLKREEFLLEWIILVVMGYSCGYDALISIMKWLLRKKEFVIKLLGFNLGFGSLIVGWYFIVTNKLWEFLLKSNEWAYAFLIVYFGDTLLWEPL